MPARLLTAPRPSVRTAERSFAHTAQLTLFDFAPNGVPIASPPHEPESAIRLVSAVGNYRIRLGDRIGRGGPRQKAEDNLRAIRRLLTTGCWTCGRGDAEDSEDGNKPVLLPSFGYRLQIGAGSSTSASPSSLFTPQSRHRVQAHRPPRRHVAGED